MSDGAEPLLTAARAFCAAWDVYDRKTTPENLRKLTLQRQAMRDAYRAEQETAT